MERIFTLFELRTAGRLTLDVADIGIGSDAAGVVTADLIAVEARRPAGYAPHAGAAPPRPGLGAGTLMPSLVHRCPPGTGLAPERPQV